MISGRGPRKPAPSDQRLGPSPGPSSAPSGKRRGGRRGGLAAQLRGHVDTPVSGEEVSGEFYIAGWTFHTKHRVRGVVVAVDDRVAAATTLTIERRDVAAQHPHAAQALLSGWSATGSLESATAVESRVDVYGILEPRADPNEKPRLGRPVLLTSITVQRVVSEDLGGGPDGTSSQSARFVWPESLSVGYNRVVGLVDVVGEVSRVRITRDGESMGWARTAAPGHSFRAERQPSALIAGFEAGVFVAKAGQVELSGVVECVDGSSVDIAPTSFEVTSAPDTGPSAQRVATVRQRLSTRLSGPADTAQAGEPPEPPVLVLTHDLGLGGGQLWLHELVVRLAQRGVPMVMTSPRGGMLVDQMEDLGIPVLVTGALDAHNPEGYEAQVRLVTQWALEHGCRRAIANTMSSFAGVDAVNRLGLPVAWAIHESYSLDQFWLEAFPPPLPTYAAERGRLALGQADVAVFEAQATLDLYKDHLPTGVGEVVPYGVDFSDIDRYREENDREALRARLGFSASTMVLLCIGTLESRKGQVNLAQAFLGSEVVRDADVTLVFVGARPGTHYTEGLRDYVEAMDGADRVRIEPVQPDTYQWYHASDVLLCASDVESLPRSMLEAMGFSTPVASTAVFGIPELITDGETGYLCGPRDLSALRQLVERTVATPRAELVAMGERARNLVVHRHDPEVYTDYFLKWLTSESAGAAS